ncbi:MAG: hypothetical protein JM58_09365 [Peptococcaceae bacterium BICA1-8]|nr:MAG: hypothetical protein JM58_09365 [Peptococcaceae bacterium BICA1-8]
MINLVLAKSIMPKVVLAIAGFLVVFSPIGDLSTKIIELETDFTITEKADNNTTIETIIDGEIIYYGFLPGIHHKIKNKNGEVIVEFISPSEEKGFSKAWDNFEKNLSPKQKEIVLRHREIGKVELE